MIERLCKDSKDRARAGAALVTQPRLIAAGQKSMPPPSPDDLALCEAALTGDAERVRAVLALGVADREARGEKGFTAFLWACGSGTVECIGALAEAGCDKDAVSDNGGTAMMEAAFSREVAAVQAVLGLGVADKEMRNNHGGRTAFLFACIKGSAGRERLHGVSLGLWVGDGGCVGSAFRPRPGRLECLRKTQDNIMLNNTLSQLSRG